MKLAVRVLACVILSKASDARAAPCPRDGVQRIACEARSPGPAALVAILEMADAFPGTAQYAAAHMMARVGPAALIRVARTRADLRTSALLALALGLELGQLRGARLESRARREIATACVELAASTDADQVAAALDCMERLAGGANGDELEHMLERDAPSAMQRVLIVRLAASGRKLAEPAVRKLVDIAATPLGDTWVRTDLDLRGLACSLLSKQLRAGDLDASAQRRLGTIAAALAPLDSQRAAECALALELGQ